MFFWLCYIIAFIPLNILYPTRVLGKRKFPKNTPVLIASNHLSAKDPILVQLKFAKKIYFLAKIELFTNKFKSFFLKLFGAIPVDRNKVAISSIKEVFKLLKKNKKICVFPQGTRKNVPFVEPDDLKNGVAMFSAKTATPVLPIAFFDKSRAFKLNTLSVGELIYPTSNDLSKENLTNYSIKIAKAINSLLPKEK